MRCDTMPANEMGMVMKARAASRVGLAGATLAACAMFAPAAFAADELKWDAQGGSSAVYTIEPKAEFEVCTRLKPGQRVVWAFVAQAPLDFSIRTARTKEVMAASSRASVREARDAFEPTREQDYCWTWLNRAEQPAQVSVQLRRR